ncbi:protein FAM83B [Odontesthes bonariensis]|uniref:protein FAM83B n=1 Tax=Odontesthes bonariensis TaxID=219752 RepID=UPI003F58E256
MEEGYFRSCQEDFHKGHYLNVLKKQSIEMDSSDFSLLSLRGEFKSENYIQPHYKESYRLAVDRLVRDGRDGYHEFLKEERIGSFLSEDELLFITGNAEQLTPENHTEEVGDPPDSQSSSGTYWPMHSDVETPNLDLGWPEILHENPQTNIDVLFHPPRLNNPTIKEVIRKHIQDARQVIAIVMDEFTDVDIFKETVNAAMRGVPVYVLLDDFHLKSFLKMAENQDVKLHQLRNMRVRTVKGQDYLCRSGAKFHGAMEQKFLLIDCYTAIYGSYSFTWSFEKINLSMVQVITGHLVKTYDEEFRTLYARSTVPCDLSPPEGLFQSNGFHGLQFLPNSHSAPKIGRGDQLRHSLDVVYQKTCERKLGTRGLEDRLVEEGKNMFRPLIGNDIGLQGQIARLNQFESAEAMNFMKRHSYAGERQGEHIPHNIRPRGSNWNVSRETRNGLMNDMMDDHLQVPQIYRGENMRRSYSGIDKKVLSMQQNIPTLENTSKSFMRTWRIESYLKNPDAPLGDSCDYLDQFEPMDKASSFMQGRMRTSLAFRSAIPEQMEPQRYANTPTAAGLSAAPNPLLQCSSIQWNPAVAETRVNNDEFMLQRQNMHILDGIHNNTGYGPGSNSYQASYASLGRSKRGQIITNPDILRDGLLKRHSVADPRSNTELGESLDHKYGGFGRTQINRATVEINAKIGGYGSNLSEDQRSVSHYDVKKISDTNSAHTWRERPFRTVSAAVLDSNSKDLASKTNSTGSPRFLKKSSKAIKSLLNIPEKKENSIRTTVTPSLTSGESTDTLTAEDEEKTTSGGRKLHQSTTTSVRLSSEHQKDRINDDHLKYSKPRFRTEELQLSPESFVSKTTTQKKPSLFDRSSRPGSENRLYSRFEPFCSFEKKATGSGQTHSQEKTKSSPKSEAAVEHNFTRGARGHSENKLERFIQRVGNLIHKNK